MYRSLWLGALVVCALGVAPAGVAADEMDLALSRLRRARDATGSNCLDPGGQSAYCPDQELFERLMAELAVAMAPPVAGPARTIGPRAFQLTIGTTVTSIEGGQLYWVRGTEGERGLARLNPEIEAPGRDGAAIGFNESPQSALAWNHLQLRKGLPFGLEAGALIGQGWNTSLWTMGAALKWGLFEGFRTGAGQLPDVSIQGAIARSVGSSQATLNLYSFDLALSKPFVVERTWTVSPFLGLQLLLIEAESGVVDLTPGGPSEPPSEPPDDDAYNSCRPQPGHQTSPVPGTVVCMEPGTGADFAHDVVFEAVRHSRLRMFLGGQTRYHMFTFAASLLFDLTVPTLETEMPDPNLESDSMAGQLAFTVSVGAVL